MYLLLSRIIIIIIMSTLITAYLPAKQGCLVFFFFFLCPALTQTLPFFEIVFILICSHLIVELFFLLTPQKHTVKFRLQGRNFPFWQICYLLLFYLREKCVPRKYMIPCNFSTCSQRNKRGSTLQNFHQPKLQD